MACLGLVPSEYSSGGTIRRGGITRTGNGQVRRALTEAAHACCHPARESRGLLKRLPGLPPGIRQIAWQAQVRLCVRFRKLPGNGKNKKTVIIATAGELSASLWAVANGVTPALAE